MKMLVAAVGTIQAPLKINQEKQTITFTLRVNSHRYLVSMVDLEQFRRLIDYTIDHKDFQVFLLGRAFSFWSHKCGQHHTGIEPILLVPFEDVSETNFQEIVHQWFTSFNGSGEQNGKMPNLDKFSSL